MCKVKLKKKLGCSGENDCDHIFQDFDMSCHQDSSISKFPQENGSMCVMWATKVSYVLSKITMTGIYGTLLLSCCTDTRSYREAVALL